MAGHTEHGPLKPSPYISNGYAIVRGREPSGWRARLTPNGAYVLEPPAGDVPCWFHRQMQHLCFGIRWERV